MPYGRIIMNSGASALFEVEGPVAGPISRDNMASDLERKFDDVLAIIKETAENAYTGLQKIDARSKPDEYEIKFGLKLTAGTDVLFAKAGSEGSFEVTLRWTNHE